MLPPSLFLGLVQVGYQSEEWKQECFNNHWFCVKRMGRL
jgi:hypothetical protein